MTASLIDIKKRIESTQMTKQITSAMQMVSAAKMARSEQYVRQFKTYADKIHEIVAHLAYALHQQGFDLAMGSHETVDNFIDFHDMLIERDVQKTGYLMVAADQGLAGSYNSTMFHTALDMLQRDHQHTDEVVLFTIGEPAKQFFEKEGYHVQYHLETMSDHPSFDEVREIIKTAVRLFKTGVFDAFYVCYNHHVNAIQSTYRVEQMLPILDLAEEGESIDMRADYLFEPSAEVVLSTLLPQYAESLIYGAIIDAKTAEHAARMIAMQSATENADELIGVLKKEYNQRRQSAITQEITEIVGGAAALTHEE